MSNNASSTPAKVYTKADIEQRINAINNFLLRTLGNPEAFRKGWLNVSYILVCFPFKFAILIFL